jgi:hypothetical protein
MKLVRGAYMEKENKRAEEKVILVLSVHLRMLQSEL